MVTKLSICFLLSAFCFYLAGQGFTLRDQAFVGKVGVPAAAPLADVTPDLLWWKLNEGSGTTIAGTAATSDDGTTDADWATGKSGSGSCLNYDGSSDDSLTDANIAWGTNIITICGWLYLDSTASDRLVWTTTSLDPFGSHANDATAFISGELLYLQLFGTTNRRRENMAVPSTGSWKHLLVVYDASTATGDMRLWLDGAEQTLTLGDNLHDGTSNFVTDKFVCGMRLGGSMFYDGKMDDVRVYSGDRSASVANIIDNPQ
jgi:hypothetical protein